MWTLCSFIILLQFCLRNNYVIIITSLLRHYYAIITSGNNTKPSVLSAYEGIAACFIVNCGLFKFHSRKNPTRSLTTAHFHFRFGV